MTAKPKLGRLCIAATFFHALCSLPLVAAPTITNGNFEGSAFLTSTQTGNSPRDFFYRAQWVAGGDGWYNSNNPQNWDPIAGGPSGSGNYGAKDASTTNRGVVNVISDGSQTKGMVTLGMKVLHRANGGAENFIVKVWGVRESITGQWDGWIDLSGPSGNADGLDVRNFNNALAPDNAGQTQSGAAVAYTGTDFTPLLTRNAAGFGLTPSENWQDVSFSFDLGQTGYDQIVVGVAFHSTSGTRSGIDDLAVLPNPPTAQLTVTNGGVEVGQFFTSGQTGNSVRDFFYRGMYAASGDGWHNSNNNENWSLAAGGAGGTASYAAKQNSANNRGVVNVITDNRQSKGQTTLHANVLYRPNGGAENFRIKVWGVRESTAGQWDGWIDLSGPNGNADGLDLRNFNNALTVGDGGQQQSSVAPTYTGTNFTQLFTGNAQALGLQPAEEWQPVSFSFDLGQIGYDQIIVGFGFNSTAGVRSGVDDLGSVAMPPLNPVLTATPPQLPPGPLSSNISLSWAFQHAQPGMTCVITSDKAGFGPYDVTAQTSNGSSTSPLLVNYPIANGDITFTLTVSDSGTGRSYSDSTTVLVPRPQPQLSATPGTFTALDQAITLNWSSLNFPANANVVINSNRTGIGPFDVTASTAANGSSTQPLIVNSGGKPIGDITFTVTVTDPVTGLSGESSFTVHGPANGMPNVLVVLVDDMGWADIAPYGGEIRTPTLQRLANNGIRFREFHNEARCAPTRNALLTGLHVQTAATDPNHNLPPMRIDNNVTIAEMLGSVGYRTYISGKWHLSEYMNQANYTPLSAPTNRGFGYSFNASLWGGDLADHHGLGTYWNGQDFTLYPPDQEIVPIKYDGTDSRVSRTPFFKTDADADYVVEYLNHHFDKNDGKPFFIYWADNAPHFDLSAPKERINLYTDVGDANPGDEDIYRYEDGWDLTRQRRYARQLAQGIIPAGTRLPPMSPDHGGPAIPAWDSLTQVEHDDLSRRMATYAAMVHGIDENLGRVVAKLEQAGQLDNTIILFMSDNGGNAEGGIFGGGVRRTGTELTEMGQNGQAGMNLGGAWANVNNTPFRYFKHDTFEGGCRTPCIVHWPAGIRAGLQGTWTEQRGHMIDVMPTLLDIAGIRYPERFKGHGVEPVQGISLRPALDGRALPDRDLMIEHERNRALYRGDWKLVTKNFSFAVIEELPAHTVELYNLRNDPNEMNNLAFHRPPMLASMVDAFNAWVDSNDGLDANRRIATVTSETELFTMPRGKELLVDLFNRPDVEDLDADQTGISGTLVGMNTQPVGDVHHEGFNPAGADIVAKKLRLSGMMENGLKVNLDHPLVLATGGFSVSFEVDSIVTAAAGADEYAGFGIGLTEAAAQAGGDIATAASFRGNAGQQQGVADFFAELDASGKVKIWKHGTLKATVDVAATQGRLLGVFETPGGFAAGASVQAKVFFNDKVVYAGSFPWRQAGASRVGISARSSDHVDIDNLVLTPLPLRDSFVGSYASSFGLADAESGPDQDPDGDGVTNEEEWMLGTNPAASDDPLRNALEVRSGDPAGIALLHRRVAGYQEAGVSYRLFYSSDLSSWTELTPQQISVIANSGSYERVSLSLPEELQREKRLFFKMEL